MMRLPAEMKGIPPHWRIYFAVKGCEDTVAKARLAGGEILAPPANVPTVGRFAVIKDPFGATFAIIQPSG
jgi:predicted enzyme related to lactoylglutathione lyase